VNSTNLRTTRGRRLCDAGPSVVLTVLWSLLHELVDAIEDGIHQLFLDIRRESRVAG
jgi:hypothetical protein